MIPRCPTCGTGANPLITESIKSLSGDHLLRVCPDCRPVLTHIDGQVFGLQFVRIIARDFAQFDSFSKKHGIPLRLSQRILFQDQFLSLHHTWLLILPGSKFPVRDICPKMVDRKITPIPVPPGLL